MGDITDNEAFIIVGVVAGVLLAVVITWIVVWVCCLRKLERQAYAKRQTEYMDPKPMLNPQVLLQIQRLKAKEDAKRNKAVAKRQGKSNAGSPPGSPGIVTANDEFTQSFQLGTTSTAQQASMSSPLSDGYIETLSENGQSPQTLVNKRHSQGEQRWAETGAVRGETEIFNDLFDPKQTSTGARAAGNEARVSGKFADTHHLLHGYEVDAAGAEHLLTAYAATSDDADTRGCWLLRLGDIDGAASRYVVSALFNGQMLHHDIKVDGPIVTFNDMRAPVESLGELLTLLDARSDFYPHGLGHNVSPDFTPKTDIFALDRSQHPSRNNSGNFTSQASMRQRQEQEAYEQQRHRELENLRREQERIEELQRNERRRHDEEVYRKEQELARLRQEEAYRRQLAEEARAEERRQREAVEQSRQREEEARHALDLPTHSMQTQPPMQAWGANNDRPQIKTVRLVSFPTGGATAANNGPPAVAPPPPLGIPTQSAEQILNSQPQRHGQWGNMRAPTTAPTPASSLLATNLASRPKPKNDRLQRLEAESTPQSFTVVKFKKPARQL